MDLFFTLLNQHVNSGLFYVATVGLIADQTQVFYNRSSILLHLNFKIDIIVHCKSEVLAIECDYTNL